MKHVWMLPAQLPRIMWQTTDEISNCVLTHFIFWFFFSPQLVRLHDDADANANDTQMAIRNKNKAYCFKKMINVDKMNC